MGVIDASRRGAVAVSGDGGRSSAGGSGAERHRRASRASRGLDFVDRCGARALRSTFTSLSDVNVVSNVLAGERSTLSSPVAAT
jgi:hypothetical protein